MQYFYESEFSHGLIVGDRVHPWLKFAEIQHQLSQRAKLLVPYLGL